MNTSLVFCVLALSSSWTPPTAPDIDPSAIFRRAEPVGLLEQVVPREFIIRGQSPMPQMADVDRPTGPRTYAQPGQSMPVNPAPSTPSTPSTPTWQAPYEEPLPNQPAPTFTTPTPQPYMTAPPPEASMWGANGPQPYRLGYSLWADVGILPGEKTSLLLDDGRFEVFEFNVGSNHTIPTWWSPWLFSLEHQFNYRNWSGPTTVDLTGSYYRLGWDMRFETPLNSQFAPFAMTLAFNPSINTDFETHLGREAFNFDGRGILFFQADPHLLFAFGAGFWDRVKDRVIPYAGLVWLPDDRWEFRIMWPQSRIQYYCGNYMGEDVWLYASGEYHIESYQIGTKSVASGQDQIELEDYRIMLGMRKSNPICSGFIEGGWVFGRKADFRSDSVNDFSIHSGFIGRVGFRF